MGCIRKLILLAAVTVIGAVLYPFFLSPEPELPTIEEKWFGKTKLKSGAPFPNDPITINKFMVNVSDEVLQDLRRRLESARFVESIGGTKFNYGFNSHYLQKVVEYWKTTFDWRKQELILNKFNHYKTQINGINIHYIHVKPTKPAKIIVPIMLIHGWPSSVWEYYNTIPLLIEPTNDIAFEVICPSIPGYGFSDAPQQEGFDVTQTARIFAKLMDRVGHTKYFVHGGDWGAVISKAMAIMNPNNVRGMHTIFNYGPQLMGMAAIKYFVGMFAPSLVFKNPETDYNKLYPFLNKFAFLVKESGYFHIQATKPDTVGAALTDSPVGIAAYILEKISIGTDPNNVNKSDGGLTQKFTLDQLLTNIMIYWTSNNVASSMRFYKETLLKISEIRLDRIKVTSVPVAVADFPNDISRSPRELTEYVYENLVQYTDMPRGGHYAAFEEPKLVTDDIKKFVKTVLDDETLKKTKPK